MEELNTEFKEKSTDQISGLIVDDDEDIRKVLETNVSVRGVRAKSVGTVSDAMEILHEADRNHEIINLVLLDLQLPGDVLGGFKIAKEIKDLGVADHVVLLTASGEDISAEELNKNGINRLIRKPFKMQEIKESIVNAREAARNNGHLASSK